MAILLGIIFLIISVAIIMYLFTAPPNMYNDDDELIIGIGSGIFLISALLLFCIGINVIKRGKKKEIEKKEDMEKEAISLSEF